MAQNDSEWPISPDLQLFQCFPTKVAQNDSEWPILPDLQIFQCFPTKFAQNDSEWPILPNLQLFRSFPTKAAQNDLEWPVLHGQIKYTLIQGNFYERLPFYIDSCALSPMASLLYNSTMSRFLTSGLILAKFSKVKYFTTLNITDVKSKGSQGMES